MVRKRIDQEIVDNLAKRLGLTPQFAQFDNKGRLTKLVLYGFDLPQFPSEIFQLTDLRVLDMRCNQLTSLPPEIGQFTNLRALHLNHNQLTTLPSEIGLLINLQELNINNNHLSFLPPTIGQLTNAMCKFLSNQAIQLKTRSLLLLIEPDAESMHQKHAQDT